MQGADYQVFLSFRGPDTRQGFTDCLYHALVDAGVRVFRDNEEIRPSEKIDEILRAINNSVVCIPIFSKDYASSKWCLCELAEMVELKKRIMPVFYDVTSDDVKLKTPLYREALTKYEKENEKEQWEKALLEVVEMSGWETPEAKEGEALQEVVEMSGWEWPEAKEEEALKEAVKIKGWELKHTGHAELRKSIVKEVLINLKVKDRIVSDDLVGMQERVEGILECLDAQVPGVRYLGIHGMGGSGKTTLAKTVFNRISASFDACSFLVDIRDSSRRGLEYVQKKLICDIRGKDSRDISDTDDGIKVLREICQSKRTLIVLDDVDKCEQIESLAGSSSWFFSSGSRIIITTRDKSMLTKHENCEDLWTLEMNEMDSKDALQLFSRHAFKTDYPPADYLDISNEVVSAVGRLPLALEITGSLLFGRRKEAWEDELSTLVKIPQMNIQKTLMRSYDALDFRTKQMFLDIACFPFNLRTLYAFCMWRSCGFRPEIGIQELISLSLVKIVDGDVIWMHDHVRDLGREIICMENFTDSGERSRLWDCKEALGVLKRKEGTGKIEVLQLPTDLSLRDCVFTPGHFQNLRNLRFLQSHGLSITGDFEHQLSKLRWLSWHSCPGDFTATNLNLENLAILDLGNSRITENWEGWNQIKVGDNLEVLDLSFCSLHKTPDLSQFRNLTTLILEGCSLLREIDSSIGKLRRLKHLNLKGCSSLQGLPVEIGSLQALEEIFLKKSSSSFTSLPESIGNWKSLVILEAVEVQITGLPHTIGRLKKLKRLTLSSCRIERLPEKLGGIHSLIELDLSGTPITELPDSLGDLEKLERLSLSRCHEIKKLPNSFGDLESLSKFDANLSSLVELPDTIGDLDELKEIVMGNCKIHELPRSVGDMKKLEVIKISSTKLCILPSTLSQLSSLRTLWLENCNQLEELPVLPTSLVSLNFSSVLLKGVPDLSGLSNLTHLRLNNLDHTGMLRVAELRSILRDMGEEKPRLLSYKNQLEFKKSLQFNISNVSTVPAGILDFFPQLESLELGCPELQGLPQLPSSLSDLVLKYLKMDAKLSCLSDLKNLLNLALFKCSIGEDGLRSLGIGKLEHLIILSVEEDCSELNGLSFPRSLQILYLLSCTYVKKLPDLSHLNNLQMLRIENCEQLSEVPGFGGLQSLRQLTIRRCKLWKGVGLQLPVCLKVLVIHSCPCLEELPNLSRLKNLESLKIECCEELLAIQGLGGLESLEDLWITDCKSLKIFGLRLPVNLKGLLIYSCTCLRKLPDLSGLRNLQWLRIYNCGELVKISGLGEMESLQELSIESCNSLRNLGRQLPVSLKTLEISSCASLKRMPDVSCLKHLQELSIQFGLQIPGIEELKWLKVGYDILRRIQQYEAV